MLPECIFHQPQIGGLAPEGGPMYRPQAREEVAEVTAEIGVKPAIGVKAEEFPNRLNRQDFAVGQRRCRTPLPQLGTARAQEIVDRAEHQYDEALEVHGRLP